MLFKNSLHWEHTFLLFFLEDPKQQEVRPPLLGETPRDLTLQDALSLKRSHAVRHVAPIALGSAPVSYRERHREVTVLGSTPELFFIRDLSMAQGRFLPLGDPRKGASVCVMGYKLKKELFGNLSALGKWVRIGDRRFQVIGVLSKKGQSLGADMSDVVVIPVATAQNLFNTTSLFRIMVQAKSRDAISRAKEAVLDIIRQRHDGEDDITVVTQDALLSTFDRIFKALTFSVAGIAGISLTVAGILIMNVMLIAVSQRREEIGLLKAIGAPGGQVLRLFLAESAVLSLMGCVLGIGLAFLFVWLMGRLFPSFPITVAPWSLGAAVAISVATGLSFGVLPARRAARLNPVQALSTR